MADKKSSNTAATGSKRQKRKRPSFFGKVKNFFKGIAKYFKDTKSELKKVVWPSKKDVKTNTVTVIAVVLIAGHRADCAGPYLRRRDPSSGRRLSA